MKSVGGTSVGGRGELATIPSHTVLMTRHSTLQFANAINSESDVEAAHEEVINEKMLESN